MENVTNLYSETNDYFPSRVNKMCTTYEYTILFINFIYYTILTTCVHNCSLVVVFGIVLPLTTVANFVGIYLKREKIATCYDEKTYIFPVDALG